MNSKERIHLRLKGEKIIATGISDTGLVRSENQDSIYLDKDGHFLLLADGMGGHERGADASKITVEVMKKYLQPELISSELREITNVEGVPSRVMYLFSLIDKVINEANSFIFKLNEKEGLERYMGSTIVGFIPVEDDAIIWFHVGDSRLYRWRDTTLECLTDDHSAHAEWVRKGKSGPEPAKNIITRAVGPMEGVVPDIKWDRYIDNDIYILCSDGLTDMVTDQKIIEILESLNNVDEIAEQLVDSAMDEGGKDNTSVVVCKF